MGKYTDLARRLETDGPQEREVAATGDIIDVNMNNMDGNRDSSIDKPTSARPEDTLQGFPLVEVPQGVASGGKAAPESREKGVTNLRTTNLTNLSAGEEVWVATPPDPHRYTKLAHKAAERVRCIHATLPEDCAVCSGYVRWLIEDEGRLRRATANREEARREFWRSVKSAAR